MDKTDHEREDAARFAQLVDLIARLRAPGGCPWDREQTHESLKPMALEEAYEVCEAIDDGDDKGLRGELGDLLLQVVFHAQIAREGGRFAIEDVLEAVVDKMIRRHPHVFGEAQAHDSGQVLRNWEALKQSERAAEGKPASTTLLASVSPRMPAVLEAFQLTTKASRVGFDWPDAAGALAKLDEEVGELRGELLAATPDARRLAAELGDILFAAVNVARRLGLDPESALKASNRKFRRRFAYIEGKLAESGRQPAESTLAEMDGLWEDAKTQE